MKDMIGYCGLDCEKCDAYLATINDDQALREKTAKLWAELNHAPILPEHINCQGCRVEGVKTVFCDMMCGVRQLLNAKFWSPPTAHFFIHSNQNNGRIASPNHDSTAILFKLSYPSHASA